MPQARFSNEPGLEKKTMSENKRERIKITSVMTKYNCATNYRQVWYVHLWYILMFAITSDLIYA